MRIKDLTGQKFGKLTVVCEGGRTENNRLTWKCICECGKETNVVSYSLLNGYTKSCGCIRGKGSKNLNTTTHGLSREPIYNVWLKMKQRCTDPKDKRYKHYGGRGITYHESWSRFETFYEDIGKYYVEGLQIDRIDNDANYCKENCKWSTRIEQANNNSRNRFVEIDGINDTIANQARRLGVTYSKLYAQIRKQQP